MRMKSRNTEIFKLSQNFDFSKTLATLLYTINSLINT